MEEPLNDSGVVVDGMLTCTKHLWQWNLDTREKVGMAERELLFYDVKREGDDILAYVEEELVYEDEEEEGGVDDEDFFNAD